MKRRGSKIVDFHRVSDTIAVDYEFQTATFSQQCIVLLYIDPTILSP